jgi:iron complex outermembrane receptor protein
MNYLQLINSRWLATAVSVLVAQPSWTQEVQVTKVELNPTVNGLEVILETQDEKSPQVFTTRYGQTLIADIVNTRLVLPSGNSFRQDNPVKGIRSLIVAQFQANSIRVQITGDTGIPKVNVGRSDRCLVLSLTPATTPTAQQTAPTAEVPATVQPESQTAPEEDDVTQGENETEQQEVEAAEGEEEIEIVVTGEQETRYSAPNATTATRTDTPIRDIP